MQQHSPNDDHRLRHLQQRAFAYFEHEANPDNGLVIDKTAPDWPASIAATGLALASYPVAVESGWLSNQAAVRRTLTTLRKDAEGLASTRLAFGGDLWALGGLELGDVLTAEGDVEVDEALVVAACDAVVAQRP